MRPFHARSGLAPSTNRTRPRVPPTTQPSRHWPSSGFASSTAVGSTRPRTTNLATSTPSKNATPLCSSSSLRCPHNSLAVGLRARVGRHADVDICLATPASCQGKGSLPRTPCASCRAASTTSGLACAPGVAASLRSWTCGTPSTHFRLCVGVHETGSTPGCATVALEEPDDGPGLRCAGH